MSSLYTSPGVQAIEGGYRVAQNETHYFDVMRMLFNWRLCLTPKSNPFVIDAGFCYVGTENKVLLLALAAAKLWALTGGDEPWGWNKNIQTGEFREPEWWGNHEQG